MKKRYFFIGINGIGMSGLAQILSKEGHEVYGSDISRKPITEKMEKMGIKISKGHYDLNVKGMDFVIYSTAIKKNNPEYLFAKLNNIPLIRRGELLATILNEKKGIAVAGTHGKTTTSSMISAVMLEKDPTIIVGGIIPEIGANCKYGNGEYLIAEADESDNSFLYMNPYYSIITNVEADHLEHHGSYGNIKTSFRTFMSQTEKKIVVNMDCKDLNDISMEFDNVVRYSICDESADIYAVDIKTSKEYNSYYVVMNGEELGEFRLKVPGKHNISNSLSVIYLAVTCGVELEEIKRGLFNFVGAKRRFDILHQNAITIVDDYAHHPTEIVATLESAREKADKRIVAVFQPHRYSRTKFLLDEFIGSFDDADKVILMPIYSAGEKNTFDVDEELLAKTIAHKSKVGIIENRENLMKCLKEDCKNGDMIIFMGAGDISGVAHEMSKRMEG